MKVKVEAKREFVKVKTESGKFVELVYVKYCDEPQLVNLSL